MKLFTVPPALLVILGLALQHTSAASVAQQTRQQQQQHAFAAPESAQEKSIDGPPYEGLRFMNETGAVHEHAVSKRRGNVFLIRHGEKLRGGRSGLSLLGQQRAQCIKHVFGSRHSERRVGYIMAQDFFSDGRRSRPFKTVEPLAGKLGIKIDRGCSRDDPRCVARTVEERTARGENVLIVWEHGRLTSIADELGVKGVAYPRRRYDIIFHLRRSKKMHPSLNAADAPTDTASDVDATRYHRRKGLWKVRSIVSEECRGLDNRWYDWYVRRGSRTAQRLVDDDSWEDDEDADELHGTRDESVH